MQFRIILFVVLMSWISGFETHLRGDEIDFDRDIRPILSDHCFPCHGPDAKQRKAEFRLDTRDGIFRDLGGYRAFEPGKPDDSEAILRIFSDDHAEVMPPPAAKLELSPQQKEKLRQWVKQGADFREHWAFVVPAKTNPPTEIDESWPTNEIDRFILARLEHEAMRPAPETSRDKLIRRISLDLTGIPPTPREIDDFLNDNSENAYEKVVDRLLASPRYGERMAWEWLDAARYADTDGFQADPTREMWPWRDWLVAALNSNMPFDQFTIEMLAGDLLPDATPSQIIATGFNRNHMYNGEGGRIPEETRIENVFDRTETTATVWLGLTMTCARCHDHKFDPVTQKEYYRLFAFFNDTSESGRGGSGKAAPTVRYLSATQSAELEQIEIDLAGIVAAMRAPDPKLDEQQIDWERELLPQLEKSRDSDAQVVEGRWWTLGTFPPPDNDPSKSFDHVYGPETKFDLRNSYADATIAWQPGKINDGKTNVLPDTVGANYLYRKLATDQEKTLKLSLGSDDSIKVWLNGEEILANDVARGVAADQESVELKLRSGDNGLLIKVVNTGGAAGFYYRKVSESILGLPENVAKAILVDREKRTPIESNLVLDHFRSTRSEKWKSHLERRAKLESQKLAINNLAASVMVMDSLPKDAKRKSYVLQRGAYDKTLDEVDVGTPGFLPVSQPGPRNRLELAKWIVSEENPLTARVTVNRYWQLFFGRGLVQTSEDFGRQGTLPSHPQLLDWLAQSFVEGGWDVKALHKKIVMSSTYRQSSFDSRGEESSYQVDPENSLLSRGARFRMPSWMLRDQALALSGRLIEQIGGQPVNPYQPEGMWAEATFGKIKYTQGTGEDLYRRSLYTFWRRIIGPPVFFDGGKRQTCVVSQSRTNSPLHALTTLNETTFVEAARNMAQRIMITDLGDDAGHESKMEKRIQLAFRLATSRLPSDAELKVLSKRWTNARSIFEASPAETEKLLSVGESKRDTNLDAIEQAAYTVVCSIILNLDEVLTKE